MNMSMSASGVYPSDEPEREDNPNNLIDELIDRILNDIGE